MKLKQVLAAAIGVVTLMAAVPASADDYRGRGYDRGGRGEITIRTDRGMFSLDRGDRLYYRLMERPYSFRPGNTYVYTDRCNRGGCLVLEFSRRGGRPDRFFAPYLPVGRHAMRPDSNWRRDNSDWRGADREWRGGEGYRRSEDRGEWRDDGRDDRDGRYDGRGGRDGRYDRDDDGEYRLEGSPRR